MMAGNREHPRWRTVRAGLRRIRAGLGLSAACLVSLGIEEVGRLGAIDRTVGLGGLLGMALVGGLLYAGFGVITCSIVPPGSRLIRWIVAAVLGAAGGIAAAIARVEGWIPEEVGGVLDPGWLVQSVFLLLAWIALTRFAGRVGECFEEPALARGAERWIAIAGGGLLAAILLRSLPVESAGMEPTLLAAFAAAASWHLRILRRAARAIPEDTAAFPEGQELLLARREG